MEVAAEFQQISISFHQNRFVSPLVEVTNPLMPSVVCPGISNIKMSHELGEVSFRGLYERESWVNYDEVLDQVGGLRSRYSQFIEESREGTTRHGRNLRAGDLRSGGISPKAQRENKRED
jgi:hypothetical protein